MTITTTVMMITTIMAMTMTMTMTMTMIDEYSVDLSQKVSIKPSPLRD
jgi:hypothetical protein